MDTINEPLEVLAQKVFPNGGQLTKIRLAGAVAYVRENVLSGTQVLELCAPEAAWTKIASVIALEDQLQRAVQQNREFTAEWAEAFLAR